MKLVMRQLVLENGHAPWVKPVSVSLKEAITQRPATAVSRRLGLRYDERL